MTIQPKTIKTIAAALVSCNYSDKPAEEQLAFVVGYLAGATAASGQVNRVGGFQALNNWSMRRQKESAAVCKDIEVKRALQAHQAGITHQN